MIDNNLDKVGNTFYFRGQYIDFAIGLEAKITDFLVQYLASIPDVVAEPQIIISHRLIQKLTTDEKIDLFKQTINFEMGTSESEGKKINPFFVLCTRLNEVRNIVAHHYLEYCTVDFFTFSNVKLSRVKLKDQKIFDEQINKDVFYDVDGHSPYEELNTIYTSEIVNMYNQFTCATFSIDEFTEMHEKKDIFI